MPVVVPPLAEHLLDPPQGAVDPLSGRIASDPEPSLPRLRSGSHRCCPGFRRRLQAACVPGRSWRLAPWSQPSRTTPWPASRPRASTRPSASATCRCAGAAASDLTPPPAAPPALGIPAFDVDMERRQHCDDRFSGLLRCQAADVVDGIKGEAGEPDTAGHRMADTPAAQNAVAEGSVVPASAPVSCTPVRRWRRMLCGSSAASIISPAPSKPMSSSSSRRRSSPRA